PFYACSVIMCSALAPRPGLCALCSCLFFFFNDPAPPEIYTLSLHDALPIFVSGSSRRVSTTTSRATLHAIKRLPAASLTLRRLRDRKSTRLNSSHVKISYAVFCLKKKKKSKRRNRLCKSSRYTRQATSSSSS